MSSIRALKAAAAAGVLAAGLLTGGVGGASASVTFGGFAVANPGYYNYTPTVIENTTPSGTTLDAWWCGDIPSHVGDTILHEQYTMSGGTDLLTEPLQAVLQETPGAWDSLYTCNPDVVEGHFVNPLGNGVTYTYAMYYVGTSSNTAGGSIGAAFSNDGVNWAKYPTPVIPYVQPPGGNNYGWAQPNAYNPGGGSAVTLLYEDAIVGEPGAHSEVTSTDGVHFSSPQAITTAGLPVATLGGWGGAAYDQQDGRWYAAFDSPGRPATMTGNVGERGSYGVTLYATGNLFSGTWTPLTTVDTNLTGYENNFLAGLLRQPDGALYGPLLPSVEMFVSTSVPRPAATATPAQAGATASPDNWAIAQETWTPGSVLNLRPLDRYYSTSLTTHEVTTGWADTSTFHLEGTLGGLWEAPNAAASVPWYSCKSGTSDYFVSLDANCEGQFYIGLEGYGYAQPGSNEIPLYRCYTGHDHFVSTQSNCEGQKTEELLGYAEVTSVPVG